MLRPPFAMPAPDALPQLPFGGLRGGHTQPFDPLGAHLAPHWALIRARSLATPPSDEDTGLMADLQIGDQTFVACAHPALTLDVDAGGGPVLLMPQAGTATWATRTARFSARAGHGVAYLSGAARRIELERGATVVVPLDRARLIRTAVAMLP